MLDEGRDGSGDVELLSEVEVPAKRAALRRALGRVCGGVLVGCELSGNRSSARSTAGDFRAAGEQRVPKSHSEWRPGRAHGPGGAA